MDTFKVSYVTTLPKEGNVPKVVITGESQNNYKVNFYNGNTFIGYAFCQTNQTVIGRFQQWYTNWFISIENSNGEIVFTDKFNPTNKTIFIKIDAYGLGDNIAWVPFVEEFRLKHNCNVICSTFFNDLFVKSYPNILFVKPNTTIENVYAQYYIGASNDDNPFYSPIKSNYNPLQMVASSILGLDYKEIKPNIDLGLKITKPRLNKKYVTLSEFGSHIDKTWKTENGWQSVVDYLNSKGYYVLVISKEPTNLRRVFDFTGDIPLYERIVDIYHSEFHIGVSSGLSWLAWGLNKHVVMISDVTPVWHEFTTNMTRTENNLDSVNYLSEHHTSIDLVLKKIDKLLI